MAESDKQNGMSASHPRGHFRILFKTRVFGRPRMPKGAKPMSKADKTPKHDQRHGAH